MMHIKTKHTYTNTHMNTHTHTHTHTQRQLVYNIHTQNLFSQSL